MRSIKVIGVGNELRSDDAVGILVARRIQSLDLPGVVVEESSGEGAALMEMWEGFDAVVLVDAVRSRAVPGTIYRFDTSTERIPSRFFRYSTHAFSLAEAVELARELSLLPPRTIVYGIEGQTFDPGDQISEALEPALEEVVDRLKKELRSIQTSTV